MGQAEATSFYEQEFARQGWLITGCIHCVPRGGLALAVYCSDDWFAGSGLLIEFVTGRVKVEEQEEPVVNVSYVQSVI